MYYAPLSLLSCGIAEGFISRPVTGYPLSRQAWVAPYASEAFHTAGSRMQRVLAASGLIGAVGSSVKPYTMRQEWGINLCLTAENFLSY